MIRGLLAILLLCCGVVVAFGRPLHGGGQATCGPYTTGHNVGDTICPTNTTNTLTAGNTDVFNFIAGGAGPNYGIGINGGGADFDGILGVLADAAGYSSGQPQFFYEYLSGGYSLWNCFGCNGGPNGFIQTNGTAVASPKSFVDGANSYDSMGQALTAASNGDTIEVKVMPSGIPLWDQSVPNRGNGFTVGFNFGSGGSASTPNNITVQLDAGVITSAITIFSSGNSVTTTASGSALIWAPDFSNASGCSGGAGIRKRTDLWPTNPNIIGHDAVNRININGFGHGILIDAGDDATGHGDAGLSTIQHVTITNTGANDGQCHAIYLGYSSPGTTDSTVSDALTDVIITNVYGGAGPALKIDWFCVPAQCHEKNVTVHCNVATSSACGYQPPFDNQCGGQRLFDFSILEAYGFGSTDYGFQWAMVSYDFGGNGCPPTQAAVNLLHIDHTYFIIDGVATGLAAQGVEGICRYTYGGPNPAGTCGQQPGAGAAWVSNSALVYDKTTLAPGYPVTMGTNVCVDATNACSGADTNLYGARQCFGLGPFPALPAYLPSGNWQTAAIAAAPGYGCTGAGSQSSPFIVMNSPIKDGVMMALGGDMMRGLSTYM